jgi:hypothetical protein
MQLAPMSSVAIAVLAKLTRYLNQSKTNSPKINRRRRGSDSRAPLARARMATMSNAALPL